MSPLRTFTGKRIDPFRMRKEDLDIVDIAHALSQECRFKGHSIEFYSVAQHSVWVSHHVATRWALAGLLHDAAEAYLRDIPHPQKWVWWMWGYRRAEKRLERLIHQKFRTGWCPAAELWVKIADEQAYQFELLHFGPHIALSGEEAWLPARAEHEFRVRFEELCREIFK